MCPIPCFKAAAYSLITIGCVLAFLSAVVPFYDTGYELMLSVLLSGLAPYMIYALCIPFLNGWLLTLPGIALVAAHGWLVVGERFYHHADYSNGLIYYIPLLLAVMMLPLVALALREPWGRQK